MFNKQVDDPSIYYWDSMHFDEILMHVWINGWWPYYDTSLVLVSSDVCGYIRDIHIRCLQNVGYSNCLIFKNCTSHKKWIPYFLWYEPWFLYHSWLIRCCNCKLNNKCYCNHIQSIYAIANIISLTSINLYQQILTIGCIQQIRCGFN